MPRTSASHALTRREFAGSVLAASGMPAASPLMVSTMTGPVRCDRLGTTLMHEHVLWFSPPRLDQPGYTPIPDPLRSASVEFAVSLLQDAARVGIHTIVDLTPHRPIDLYRQIAARTTVRIVPSTGFYRRGKIPKRLAEIDDETQMEERMRREIADGIDGTAIRAGIIKIATEGSPFSDWEKKVFRAAARVQARSSVPIMTHVGGSAREQFDLLVKAGANPRRICLSHVDTGGPTREKLLESLLGIVKEGGYLEVDTFGQEFYTPWPKLVFLLRSLCDAGFANRIFISVDCNWHWEAEKKVFEGGEAPRFDPGASKRTYAYMMTDAVPQLRSSGFRQKEIDIFLVENPRRFFSGL